MKSVSRLLIACFGLGLLVGCQGKVEVVPVAGKITYGGGAWPTSGMVTFACIEPAPGYDNQPGSAVLNEDGSYRTELVPGKYVLNIAVWEVPPSPEDPASAKSYLPDKYQSGMQSGFEIDVPADQRGVLTKDFDVPKK